MKTRHLPKSLNRCRYQMKNNLKLNAISAAIFASLLSVPVTAVSAEAEDQAKSEDVEVIKVTGFRGSLKRALNAKRFSSSVTDSIHAEDVGKSTDQNIADALSRVTGISVQEEGGEGTRISIRGTSPGQNQISMNGVALTGGLSTDGSDAGAVNDNSVDLSSFSSDILASIDVMKTSAADQDEGSLGGTVVLKTVKPLRLNEARRAFTVEGRHNEFADENDYRLNVSYADKFFDDTLGVVFTASKDKQKTRQDRVQTGWVGALPIEDAGAGKGRMATDLATGKAIRVLGYQKDDEGQIIYGEDGKALLNPIESLVDYDPDTQIIHEGDLYVSARNNANFSLNTDQRDRFSVSAGIQFSPVEGTDIQLDVTHTEQDIYTDNHTLRMNISAATPLLHENDDNLALNTVDLETNTLVRSLSRSITGGFSRASGLREVDTNVVSLSLEQSITDNLKMDLKAGYSQTTDETPDQTSPDRYVTLGTNTWGTAGRNVVEGMPDEILEKIGYDCTEGSLADCNYITGTKLAEFDAMDGTANLVYSRFNVFDMQHNHLGNLTFRNNKASDTNKSVFLDFDWELDGDYITSIEFGAKWSHREKDVDVQNVSITNADELVDLDDPNATFESRGMGTIKVADILSGDAFPYDDFAEDIQTDRSNPFFGGWPMLDADRAIEVATGRAADELGVRPNNNGTRNIITETKAAYFKTNFELMDGSLRGNIGLRYVKDESEATGLGGINYVKFPQMLDPHDLLVVRGLANIEGSDPCPVPEAQADGDTRYAPVNDDQLSGCWAWQVSHGYDYGNNETIPYDAATGEWLVKGADGLTGPDVNRLVFVDANGNISQINELPSQVYDQNGNLVSASQNSWAHFSKQGHMWPFLDRTTSFTGPNGNVLDTYVRTASVTNYGSNDVWLPSLNLNYAINDETIARFAVTKTMTRPSFDYLNPRVTVYEQQWGAGTGAAGNTQLKPLTSTNVDFSYEWYFEDEGLLSLALFYKDMKNFVTNVSTPYHYKDVRTQYELESADLLLDYDENRAPGDEDKCMPMRQVAGFFTEWVVACDVANINTVKNGNGATVKGLELSYNQVYDFLPGFLSGFGFNFNYTYQQSESDPVAIGTTGLFQESLPQPFTPEHSANATLFWEKDGLQMRLANRFTGDQLVNEGVTGGSIWQEASNRLDFSSSYKLTKSISLTFQALNITDETRRNFFLTRLATNAMDRTDVTVVSDEGNYFNNSGVTTERTLATYKTGRQFRIGIRGTF